MQNSKEEQGEIRKSSSVTSAKKYPETEGLGEGTYQRLVPSHLDGMDQVPVAVGLAVWVQPVLQELLLGTVFQEEQMVHVLL